MDLSLTTRGYSRHLEREHPIGALTNDRGEPAKFSYPLTGDTASRDHLLGFINGVAVLAEGLAKSVDKLNVDKRRSAEGRRDSIIDAGEKAATAVHQRFGVLFAALSAGRLRSGMAVEAALDAGDPPLTDEAARILAEPFRKAIESTDMWLSMRGGELTTREWVALIGSSARFVHPESGELVHHVTPDVRRSETRKRVYRSGPGGAARVRNAARFADALAVVEIVSNSALQSITEKAHLVAQHVATA